MPKVKHEMVEKIWVRYPIEMGTKTSLVLALTRVLVKNVCGACGDEHTAGLGQGAPTSQQGAQNTTNASNAAGRVTDGH